MTGLNQIVEPLHGLHRALLLDDVQQEVGGTRETEDMSESEGAVDGLD